MPDVIISDRPEERAESASDLRLRAINAVRLIQYLLSLPVDDRCCVATVSAPAGHSLALSLIFLVTRELSLRDVGGEGPAYANAHSRF